MNRDQKAAVIEEVATQIRESDAVFAVDYRGISVPQAAELRQRLGEAEATLRVVKNTLTERAADQAGAESLKELLEGPTALTFVRGDAALAAKAIATFRRGRPLLEFKGGTMDGAPLSTDQVEAIARLPARDVLSGQLVGVLASPVTGLVRGLNQLIQGLAMQLGQIAEQGLVSGEAPAPAPSDAAAPEAEAPAEEASTEAEPPASPEAEPEPAAETEPPETEDEPAAAETDAEPAAETEDAPYDAEGQAGGSGEAAADEDAPAQDEASGDQPAENESDTPSEGGWGGRAD